MDNNYMFCLLVQYVDIRYQYYMSDSIHSVDGHCSTLACLSC